MPPSCGLPDTAAQEPSLSSPQPGQFRKATMPETYSVATMCRLKLVQEADLAKHDLRRVAGHANTLDLLIDDIYKLERGLAGRIDIFIQTPPSKPRKVGQMERFDTILEELEEIDEEDFDSDDNVDDDIDSDEEDRNLILQRWPSRVLVPQLTDDDDSESDSEDSEPNDQDSEIDDENVYDTALPTFAKHLSISTNDYSRFGTLQRCKNQTVTGIVISR